MPNSPTPGCTQTCTFCLLPAEKFEAAKKWGATDCVNPKDYDKPIQQVGVGGGRRGSWCLTPSWRMCLTLTFLARVSLVRCLAVAGLQQPFDLSIGSCPCPSASSGAGGADPSDLLVSAGKL